METKMESSTTIINSRRDLRIESKGVAEEEEEKCDSVSHSSFFLRKIEFHPARKQFNGFGSNHINKSDFRIETLKPDSGRARLPLSNSNLSESASSSSGKRVDGPDFVENGLDPELTFGITFRKIGAGLENLGNTCFLNSVLQCLTYTEPLAAYLQSGKHQTSCHVAGFCALCAIQKHVSRALQSTGRSLVPKDLVSNLRCISRNFRNARQEDAHEYMVNLLESMHKCCLPSGVPSESPAAYEKSLVHKIFGGRLRSQVECQQCSFCSNKFDPFLDLSLEIVKADSLPVALRNFTAAELLDGGEKHYQCQKCKQKVRAKKRLTVHNAPNVLTIHLKRFHAHDPGRKVDKKVLFDHSLDMKPFVSGSYEGDLKYSLYGVLVHYGHSTHSGHYVCFVRTSSRIWYLLNDNEVRPVSEKVVLDQKAYMLFYVRDRKNIVPNRSSDVVRKETMKATVSNNLANLGTKQMPKEQVDTLIGNRCSTEKIPQKEASDQPLVSKCSLEKTKSIAEPFAGSPLQKDPSEGVSQKPDLGECLLPSAPSMIRKCDPAKVDKKSSNCNGTQNSPVEKHVTNESLEKFNVVLHARVEGAVENAPGHSQSDFSDRVNNETDSVKFPVKPNSESSQGGSLPHHRIAKNLLGDEAGDSGQQSVNELAKLSNPSVTPNECPHEKAPDRAPHKKSRKLLKCRISNMPLGFKFFRASLGLRKRKKYKKGKRGPLGAHNLIGEQLLEGTSSSSQLGASTSKMFMSVSLHSKSSRRKKAKPHSKCRGDSLMNIVDEEFEKRNQQNGDAVPMDEVKQHNGSGLDCRKTMRKQTENGMMCILTRGLEETTVARWDEVELPKSQIVESSTENLHIGYVPDEWDEEYDRGKRKKLRQNKHDFGGPNPFQEIASKKMQFKKAKMDRSSSGNKPFRI